MQSDALHINPGRMNVMSRDRPIEIYSQQLTIRPRIFMQIHVFTDTDKQFQLE